MPVCENVVRKDSTWLRDALADVPFDIEFRTQVVSGHEQAGRVH
jgi:hypothetical protein